MKNVSVLLYVTRVKTIRTKTGKQMAFISGNDTVGDLSVTVFPQLFSQIQSWLKKDLVLLINGNVEERDALELIANSVVPASNALSSFQRKQPKIWYLRLNDGVDKRAVFAIIKELANQANTSPVVVYDAKTEKVTKLESKLWLPSDDTIKEKLVDILGSDNVVYK